MSRIQVSASGRQGAVQLLLDGESSRMTCELGFHVELADGTCLESNDFQLGSTVMRDPHEAVFQFHHEELDVSVHCQWKEGTVFEWWLTVGNRSGKPLALKNIALGAGQLNYEQTQFEIEHVPWRLLNIGLQSTDMHAGICEVTNERPYYFDSMTVFHQPADGMNILMGCISFQTYFSHLLVSQHRQQAAGSDTFDYVIANHYEGMLLDPDEITETERAAILIGPDHNRLFSVYMDLVVREMQPRSQFHQAPTGWLSWYYYYGTVTEQDILDNVHDLRDQYPELNVEYIVIDAGWFLESGFGDWEANEKFPHGMKWLADQIKAAGYKPGLWFSPLLADSGSRLLERHPDWVLKQGMKYAAGMNPSGSDVLELHEKNKVKFVLDLTHPEVLDYLKAMFTQVTQEWGYSYIKLDFLIRALFTDQGNHSSLHRDQVLFPGTTTAAAYRKAMQAIREGAGEGCFILGCAAPLFTSAGGFIDGNRMTPDITRRNYVPDSPRPTYWELIKICGITMAARYFLHGKIGYNDPDVLVVRGHEPEGISDDYKPSLDEARVWAGVVALSGGMLFYNDKLSDVEEERRSLLKQVFPPGPGAAVPIDFFQKDGPELWNLHLYRGDESWVVLGVFNWGETVRDIDVDLSLLDIAASREVLVQDIWEHTYLGLYENQLCLTEIPPHSMRLLAIRTVLERPQLLSTAGHFTQGWAEFTEVTWAAETFCLRWNPDYKSRGPIKLYIPEPYRDKPIEISGGYAEVHLDILSIMPLQDGECIRIRFMD
ncbi:alpha-galactosidase [Paenibacillus mendelii]|uniref:Alpha-galactosidase n=1 Tax=Paenibacillus mendelii TaxID=206163 RepID=A0ABV6JCL5_9BACL|nr:alpha-galactosidase [Paenibacillus mendelii]MCQ6561648.1 alpha-galactosidase [Paenibacillus mendelii]